jgi:DNA-binding NarL/FixJ family response regulator
MPVTVLVADDHEKVRDAITRHLSSDPEIKIVAVTDGFAKAIELCSRIRPDIVLMDVHLSDEKTVTPERVKSCLAQSRLIAMSIWSDEETKILADTFGALVLLRKASLTADLIPAIKLCAKL